MNKKLTASELGNLRLCQCNACGAIFKFDNYYVLGTDMYAHTKCPSCGYPNTLAYGSVIEIGGHKIEVGCATSIPDLDRGWVTTKHYCPQITPEVGKYYWLKPYGEVNSHYCICEKTWNRLQKEPVFVCCVGTGWFDGFDGFDDSRGAWTFPNEAIAREATEEECAKFKAKFKQAYNCVPKVGKYYWLKPYSEVKNTVGIGHDLWDKLQKKPIKITSINESGLDGSVTAVDEHGWPWFIEFKEIAREATEEECARYKHTESVTENTDKFVPKVGKKYRVKPYDYAPSHFGISKSTWQIVFEKPVTVITVTDVTEKFVYVQDCNGSSWFITFDDLYPETIEENIDKFVPEVGHSYFVKNYDRVLDHHVISEKIWKERFSFPVTVCSVPFPGVFEVSDYKNDIWVLDTCDFVDLTDGIKTFKRDLKRVLNRIYGLPVNYFNI